MAPRVPDATQRVMSVLSGRREQAQRRRQMFVVWAFLVCVRAKPSADIMLTMARLADTSCLFV